MTEEAFPHSPWGCGRRACRITLSQILNTCFRYSSSQRFSNFLLTFISSEVAWSARERSKNSIGRAGSSHFILDERDQCQSLQCSSATRNQPFQSSLTLPLPLTVAASSSWSKCLLLSQSPAGQDLSLVLNIVFILLSPWLSHLSVSSPFIAVLGLYYILLQFIINLCPMSYTFRHFFSLSYILHPQLIITAILSLFNL